MRVPALLLVCLMPLAGCATGTFNTLATLTTSPNTLTGNWQIQSGPSISPATNSLILLTGALQQEGTQVTGTFTGTTICPASLSPTQTVTMNGTFDAGRNLTLTATPTPVVSVRLAVPEDPTQFSTGTLNATGTVCALALQTPAIAVEIPSVTGSYTGSVTAGTLLGTAPIPSGTSTLTLTQTSTANASGQFSVTGSARFSSPACTSTTSLSGTVSGAELILKSTPNSTGLSQVNAVAFVTPAGINTLQAFSITYDLGPCNAGLSSFSSYTGTLTRQ